MIRIKIRQLLDDKSFNEGRHIPLGEVSERSGIASATLSRIANVRAYNMTMSNVDALCAYFDCQPGDLLEYVPKPAPKGTPATGSKPTAAPRKRAVNAATKRSRQ